MQKKLHELLLIQLSFTNIQFHTQLKSKGKKMELNDDGRITRSLSTALSFAVLIIWNKIIFIY